MYELTHAGAFLEVLLGMSKTCWEKSRILTIIEIDLIEF